MSLTANEFANGMPDRLVVERQARVGGSLVRIDRRGTVYMSHDKTVQVDPVGPVHRLGGDAIGVAVLRSDDGGLADRAAAGAKLLRVVLVLLLAAHVGFVHLDGTGEGVRRARLRFCGLAQAMEHEPRGLLRDLQVAVEFHAGYALEVRRVEVDAGGPDAQLQLAAFHDTAGADAELRLPARLAAVLASMRLRRMRGSNDIGTVASRAANAFWPAHLPQPLTGILFGTEHVGNLGEREAVAMGFPGTFHGIRVRLRIY